MKRITVAILSLVFVHFTGLLLKADTVVFTDDFNRAALTTGAPTTYTTTATGDGGGSISGSTFLQLTNDSTVAGNANGLVFVSGTTSSYSSPYAPSLKLNDNVNETIQWSFNAKTNRTNLAGFGSGNYGMGVILGADSTNLATANGYAVVWGNSSTPDPARLVSFSGGIASATNIINNTAAVASPDTNYMSVRITYDTSTSTWSLYYRDDGVAAWADPTTTSNLIATATNATFANAVLSSFGFAFNYSTAAGQTVQFDNYSVKLIDNAVVGGSNHYWIGNDTTLGGSGTWDASSTPSWSASNTTIAATTWDSTRTAAFGGTTSGTVTVNGSFNAGAGITFTTDGYQISPGANAKIVLTGADQTANTINVDSSVTATIGTVLDGFAGMTKNGAGTLVLTANNTYTGGTAVAIGTLQIGNGGTSGSLSGDITTNATLKFNRSDSFTVANNISGAGTVIQAGPGTLILTGAASHTGATNVTGGTLQVGDGSTAGSLSGSVTLSSGATLAFNQPGDLTFSGSVSGAGALSVVSATKLILNGSNNFTGGTTIPVGGTVQVGSGSTTGTLTNDVHTSGTLAFNRASNFTFNGNIDGTGVLVQQGTSKLTLIANATHTGGTSITSSFGSIQIGNGGTTGSLAGNVSNGGSLIFDRSDAITFSGAISGVGLVVQAGTGAVSLAGSNSYSGGTTVQSGTLKALNSSSLGDPAGVVSLTKGTMLASTTGVTIANPITVADSGAGTGGLLAFWNFSNSTPGSGNLGTFNTTGTVEVFDAGTKKISIASSGVYAATASIDLSNLMGTGGGSASNNWGTFGGTTVNEVVADANSQSLAIVGSGNNAHSVVYKLTTAGYKSLVATYTTQGTASGFTSQSWSYSTDGITFTDFNPAVAPPSSFALATVDLSAVTALDNQPNVYLKVTFSGATATNGNNRIDNVQFNALPIESALTPNASLGSDITSGSVTYSGPVTINNNVALTSATGGTVNFSGALTGGTGGGSVVKTGGGTVVLSGNNTYTGPTFVQGGTLVLVTGTTNNLAASSRIMVGDTAAHSSAVLDVTQVNTSGGGFHVVSGQTLAGHGTVLGNVTAEAGSFVGPGGNVGTLTITGNLALTGTLQSQVNGGASDQLNVSGQLNLTGSTEEISFPGFPTKTNYTLAHYGTRIGTFSTVTGLPSGATLDLVTGNNISMHLLPQSLRGNFNLDNVVDSSDITAMLAALTDLGKYQNGGNPLGLTLSIADMNTLGDFDNSGNASTLGISNADIQGMLNYIASISSGSGSITSVPEPKSWLLFALGGTAMLMMTRRKLLQHLLATAGARKISPACR